MNIAALRELIEVQLEAIHTDDISEHQRKLSSGYNNVWNHGSEYVSKENDFAADLYIAITIPVEEELNGSFYTLAIFTGTYKTRCTESLEWLYTPGEPVMLRYTDDSEHEFPLIEFVERTDEELTCMYLKESTLPPVQIWSLVELVTRLLVSLEQTQLMEDHKAYDWI